MDLKQALENIGRLEKPKSLLNKETIAKISGIAIIGCRGEGKTALGYQLLEECRGNRELYVYKHPKPEFLKVLNIGVIDDLDKLNTLHNAVVLIDEPQLLFPVYDKRANNYLEMLSSIARQRNLTLIYSTIDTTWFSRSKEKFCDAWCIKSIDFDDLKQGSKVKKIIQEYKPMCPQKFTLEKDEYLLNLKDELLLQKFKCPDYFVECLSKPYNDKFTIADFKRQMCEKISDKTPEKRR